MGFYKNLLTDKNMGRFIKVVWLWLPLFLVSLTLICHPPRVFSTPTIHALTPVSSTQVPQYERFEASFSINDVVATDFFFPYDAAPPPGVIPGTGVTVDARILPPGESDWNNARILPCFFYQPMIEAGSGTSATFLPHGSPHWRMRFSPEIPGEWLYKIRATDSGGSSESSASSFTCIASDKKGFVKVSASDPKWFEFSDGSTFFSPLINVEEGNPLNGLHRIRSAIPLWGENGVQFIRWFPTDEGANYAIYPFGGEMLPSWGFGRSEGADTSIDADAAAGKKFSFVPYPYSAQTVPAVPGALYRFSLRAKVTSPGVLKIKLQSGSNSQQQMVSDTDGWRDFSIECANSATGASVTAYATRDTGGGAIRLHSLNLQRDETGAGGWGPNLLAHPDPDSFAYIDQRHAALLDEVFSLSEQYGIYHKLTVTHKNDGVLGRFNSDGTINSTSSYSRVYSGANQACRWYQQAWWRYIIARWSYSASLHSLEFANENDPNSSGAYNAAFALAQYFIDHCPRKVLISNSYWHSFPTSFWSDPRMDYCDEHAYLNNNSNPPSSPFRSHSLYDSALSARQCWNVFKSYNVNKPILRGETGLFNGDWSLGWHPDLALDTECLYDKKMIWAHVGTNGYLCDGQWNLSPLRSNDKWLYFKSYRDFMLNEPLSNGNFEETGTDLSSDKQILTTNSHLRAWGVRDLLSPFWNNIPLSAKGRILLWIDNDQHTWKNVVDGVAIEPVSGALTLQGLPTGNWNGEWRDTTTGGVSNFRSFNVTDDGKLIINVSSLSTDAAIKLSNAGNFPPFVSFVSSESIGDERVSPLFVPVCLSIPATQTVSVDCAVSGGTAVNGLDYIFQNQTLIFSPGETLKNIEIIVIHDEYDDSGETIELTLMNPCNALMGNYWRLTHAIVDVLSSRGWKDYD